MFWWNEAVEVIEAIEVVEAVEVIEAIEVLRPGKSQLGTSGSSRFLNLALFWCLEKIIFWGRVVKYPNVRGCWGQPKLLFWKLVDETQMGNPCDHAVRDISSKLSIFLPLRAIYFRLYRYETPCIRGSSLKAA